MKKMFFTFLCFFLFLFIRPAFSEANRIKIVVFDLDITSKDISVDECLTLSEYIRTSFIAAGSFNVVSREQLDKVFKEYEFQASGLTVESNALRIGNLFNARNAVLGTIGKFGQTYIITIKLLDLENGAYLAGGEVRAKNKDDVLGQLKAEVESMASKVSMDDLPDANVSIKGEWIVDRSTGIKVWNPNPIDNESISWSGGSINGKANGIGVFFWLLNGQENGRVEGEFINGFPKKGIETFSKESIYMRYEGEFKDWQRHGRGTLVYKDGVRYEGDFVENNMTGNGIYYFADGSIYQGSFKNNYADGMGIMRYKDGSRYEGYWLKWQKTGKGIQFTNAGDRYEGDFVENEMTGNGTCYYQNGSVYKGNFKDYAFEGIGSMTFSNGDRYDGEWEKNERTGNGTYNWVNGDRYVGEFLKGEMSGKGILYTANGNRYDGQFSNNTATGGWFYFAKGEKYWAYQKSDGTWQFEQQKQQLSSSNQPELKNESLKTQKNFIPVFSITGGILGLILGPIVSDSDATLIQKSLGWGSVFFLCGLIIDGIIYLVR